MKKSTSFYFLSLHVLGAFARMLTNDLRLARLLLQVRYYLETRATTVSALERGMGRDDELLRRIEDKRHQRQVS